MKLYIPPERFLGAEMARRLRDQQQDQAVKRAVGELTGTFDVKELRALKFLAFDLFGPAGLVQFVPYKRGIAQVGRRVYFRGHLGQRLFKIEIFFEGATVEEISRQVKTWKEHRT